MSNPRPFFLIALAVACVFAELPHPANAHAFPDHSDPEAGSQLTTPPKEIKIWFTVEVKLPTSGLEIFDHNDKQIDNKDAHLDDKDKTLLIVTVPPLSPGTYKVHWHAVTKDTHKTQGDYKFEIISQK
jgi:methionine-rich copper-binding protein CopC